MTVSNPEPSRGQYDWDEAFRQNAERGLPEYFVPDEERARIF
jgi:hypothetical protein